MAGGAALVERELYGGAIKCSLPASFTDCSNFRLVPDHQEVWADEAETDRSIIIEILDKKEGIEQNEIKFFLKDLAEFNDATESEVLDAREAHSEELPFIPASAKCFRGKGRQATAKYNEGCRNVVQIFICAIRLEEQDTDILITLNDPLLIDPQSSSGGLLVESGAEAIFNDMLRSFKIVDFGLFGSS